MTHWFFRGAAFLLHSAGVWPGWPVTTDWVAIPGPRAGSRILARVYRPRIREPRAGIVLLHGLNTLGVREPRMAALAAHLAAAGFLVVAPEVTEIARLAVQPSAVEGAEEAVIAALESPLLAGFGACGFVSASFSAGIGLILLSRSGIAKRIGASLLVGPYARFRKTAEFVADNFARDNYAALVLLSNYLGLVITDSEALCSALLRGAMRNAAGCRDFGPWVSEESSKLPARDRQILHRLFADRRYRRLLVETVTDAIPPGIARCLSPEHYIDRVRCPVVFIHGRDDPVVSSAETVWLADQFRLSGKLHRTTVTRLLTHGDRVSYTRHVHELPSLAGSVGYFFQQLCSPGRQFAD